MARTAQPPSTTLQYIASGRVPVKDLITRHVKLDDVMTVFDIVAKGEAIKVTVEP